MTNYYELLCIDFSLPASAHAAIPNRKPGSASSTRSSCSNKSSTSVRSMVSAKSTSSTYGKSVNSDPVSRDLDELHDYDEGQDVRFINVPSSRETNGPVRVASRQLNDISPDEIVSN